MFLRFDTEFQENCFKKALLNEEKTKKSQTTKSRRPIQEACRISSTEWLPRRKCFCTSDKGGYEPGTYHIVSIARCCYTPMRHNVGKNRRHFLLLLFLATLFSARLFPLHCLP